jgi:hypothetical protein
MIQARGLGMAIPPANAPSISRREFIWPAVAILLGGVVATNSFYEPQIPLAVGIAAWFADLTLVLVLSARPATTRMAVLVAGLFLAIPCLLWAQPFARALLMCCMALPLAIATLSSLAPSITSFRERLAYVLTWLGTREVKRRPRCFDTKALLHLVAATVILAIAIACVKRASQSNLIFWRWFSGGIMFMAFAEMATAAHHFLTALIGLSAPPLMRSPMLSTSLTDFWTRRWNPAASALVFRRFFFAPLARWAAQDPKVRELASCSPSLRPSPAGRGGIVSGLDANPAVGLVQDALEEVEATDEHSLSQRERVRVRESLSNETELVSKPRLARRATAYAMFAAFLASAIAHVLLPLMATARWDISLMCGAFFLVQPLFIVAERRMRVRRWLPAAGRAWTLAILTITSPLFVEPALQIIEPSWGAPDTVLTPVIAVLGFVIVMNAFFALGSLAAVAQEWSRCKPLETTS